MRSTSLAASGWRLAGTFALAALAACDSSNAPEPQVPTRLDIVAGDAQEATVDAELASPLVVKIVDQKGKPVEGQIVNFRVVSGGGSVFAGAAQTNADGEARERWKLGTSTAVADSQRVEARAVDPTTGQPLVFATFKAVAKAAAPARALAVSSATRTGTVGAVVADSLAVQVTDRFNNPVANVDVVWAAAAGSGSVAPATSRTGAAGVAKAAWTLGGTRGAQTATATVASLSAVTFTATANTGAAARVVITPRTLRFTQFGQLLGITVAVTDAFGNPVAGAAPTVVSLDPQVVAVVTGGGGGGSAPPFIAGSAESNGTARIVASVGSAADTIIATVQQVVRTMTVSPSPIENLRVGGTVQLIVTARDSAIAPIQNPQVTWRTSNASVVTVSSTGLVTATGVGSATITADAGTVQQNVPVTVLASLRAVSDSGVHACTGIACGSPSRLLAGTTRTAAGVTAERVRHSR